jgi:hypothetical protein
MSSNNKPFQPKPMKAIAVRELHTLSEQSANNHGRAQAYATVLSRLLSA